MLQRLAHALAQREAAGNLRSLKLASPHGIDFFSNDYLGLAQHAALAARVSQAYEAATETHRLGATGSRLLSGNSQYAMELETRLARLFGGEAALLFNSGYAANMALVACLAQKGDAIVYDELVHASLREGYRLSHAARWAFKHNDPNDLEAKLQTARRHASGEVLVLTESVYSMDGDNGTLAETLALCQGYGVQAVLDEAHSTGIVGQGGSGLACALGLEQAFLARVYTFGKAIGAHGACIVGSQVLIDYLVNFARPFIFSTAMPLHNLVSIQCAFDLLQTDEGRALQQQLLGVVAAYQTAVQALTLPPDINIICNQSPIQVLVVSGNARCKALAAHLVAQGFEVRAILSPTVKAGEERLRICLHSFNRPEQVQGLVQAIGHFF